MNRHYPAPLNRRCFAVHLVIAPLVMLCTVAFIGCGGNEDAGERDSRYSGSMLPESVSSQLADSLAVSDAATLREQEGRPGGEQTPPVSSAAASGQPSEQQPATGAPAEESASAMTDAVTPEQAARSARSTGEAPRSQAKSSAREYGPYYLQIGAFRSPDNAQRRVAQLAQSGVQAQIVEAISDGERFYRVYVTGLPDEYEAQRLGERLQDEHGFTYLVREQ